MSAVATVEPGTGHARATTSQSRSGPRVAYVVSRFPRLTETFIVSEVAAALRAGADVHLHPLHRERTSVVQPAAAALADRVHHVPLLAPRVLWSQVTTLATQPCAYTRVLGALIRHNWGSRRFLVGALASFPLAVHLASHFRRSGVDHVHAHFASHPAAVAYVVHRLTGIPYSFTAHGSDLHRDRHMLAEKVRQASFVVAVSEYNRQVIIRECGDEVADRVVVVRCGIDPEAFPAQVRPLRRPGDPIEVCCVGTLHEVKGQSHLMAACQEVRSEGIDVRLTFVGGGPDRAALTEMVRGHGLDDVVRFTGPLTQPAVLAELRRADVLAAPSVPSADGRREGLPVVILEAMTVGVPVVASRLSGIPEVVVDGETGLLADPGDVRGLAHALTALAASPELADRLSRAAHLAVARDFDVDASARALVARFARSAT